MPWIATGVFVYQSFITESKDWGTFVIAQSFMVYSILSEILDELFRHTDDFTELEKYFKRASSVEEINGEMLQILSRVYWMTGKEKYLNWAIKISTHPQSGYRYLVLLKTLSHSTKNQHILFAMEASSVFIVG